MKCDDIEDARRALCVREGIKTKNWTELIGSWQLGQPDPIEMPQLSQWASGRGVNAVIWTALRPRFNDEERSPSLDELLIYLHGLTGRYRDRAREYIEKAPIQIDTDYRRKIIVELGWFQ